MLLRDFTLISPDITLGEIFEAIETAIPTAKITEAIDSTGSREQRNRRLPTHVVVALVIAMHFWYQELSLWLEWLIYLRHAVLDQTIPPRQGRSNPRVVKKPRSKFCSRKPAHRGSGSNLERLAFAIPNTG